MPVGMSDPIKGILAIIIACVVWGLSPLFYNLLSHVPPGEVLAHRTLWSTVLFGGVLAVQGRLSHLWACFRDRKTVLILMTASLMIACNWLLFIISVQVGKVVESSFGYYVFPLVAVVLGRIVFKEHLSKPQKFCVALAALAVVFLGFGLGVTPWIALTLAVTFGTYSMLKKLLTLGPVVSVTAEVLILAPIATLWLLGLANGWWQEGDRTPAITQMDISTTGLLILSGPLTAIPLILFSFAAKRIALSTVGLVQYLNPTLQFACAVVVFGEVFTSWHAAAFALIWVAVAIYSYTSIQSENRARKRRNASSAV